MTETDIYRGTPIYVLIFGILLIFIFEIAKKIYKMSKSDQKDYKLK